MLASALAWGAKPLIANDALHPVTLSTAQRQALGIQAATPQAARLAVRSFPATVVLPASQAQIVASPTAGLIARVLVEPNQAVAAAQPIASVMSNAVSDAAALLIQVRSEAGLTAQTETRERSLFAEGVIAQARVRQAEAAAVQARARLQAARAQLRLLGLSHADLEKIGQADTLPNLVTLRSPAAGFVTELAVAAGQRIDAGTLVARIARPDRLALEIRIPAADLGLMQAGARVLDDRDEPIAQLAAPNAAIVTGQSAALRVPLRIDSPGRWILGQTVEVRVQTGQAGWRVPRNALTRIGANTYVFVQQGDRFVPQRVVLRGVDGDAAVVGAPFAAATRVAAGNVAEIKAAAQGVAPAPDPQAPAAAASGVAK